MKGVNAWKSFALPLFVLVIGASADRMGTCKTIPADLRAKLRKAFSEAEVVSLAMLSPTHRGMFEREHKGACPGAVKLDFFGDGSDTYAVLLVEKARSESILVVAKRAVPGLWNISVLQRGDARPVPAIWSEEPSEYEDLWKEKKLTPLGHVVVIAGYESWARVYGWDGTKAEWVQVSD